MSYERMQQEEKRLRREIRALTGRAAKRDAAEDVQFGPDFRGDQLPEELQRREDRLAKIREAKRRLEARKREEAEAAERDRDDDPPKRGRPRKYPLGKPKPKNQENFTDPQSRIMKDGSGAFQQCYNAELAVDGTQRLAEPPFGWIKQGLGFRQFSLRGLQKVTGEFNLVCLALNLRRMATMIRWA